MDIPGPAGPVIKFVAGNRENTVIVGAGTAACGGRYLCAFTRQDQPLPDAEQAAAR